MANPFYVAPPDTSSALQQLMTGYDRGQKAQQEMALREAGQLFSRGDVAGAQAAAARGGSLQALMGFAGLANNDRDYAFRQQEAERSQKNTEASRVLQERGLNQSAAHQAAAQALARQQFEFQRQTANQAEIKIVKDANGNETLVRVDRQGNASPINTGVQSAPTNPYAVGGKFNESQGKSATYSDRMAAAHDIITSLENINKFDNPRGGFIGGVLQGVVPDNVYNTFAGPDRQKIVQAQRDFVNAVLRRESGAVINPSEFDNSAKQYFPQPGDSQQVIEQKRRNRITTMQGLMREAGPGYKPPKFSTGPAQQSSQKATQQYVEGATATNPQTGERITFRGGQWIPAQ